MMKGGRLPKQARYQAALRPVARKIGRLRSGFKRLLHSTFEAEKTNSARRN